MYVWWGREEGRGGGGRGMCVGAMGGEVRGDEYWGRGGKEVRGERGEGKENRLI